MAGPRTSEVRPTDESRTHLVTAHPRLLVELHATVLGREWENVREIEPDDDVVELAQAENAATVILLEGPSAPDLVKTCRRLKELEEPDDLTVICLTGQLDKQRFAGAGVDVLAPWPCTHHELDALMRAVVEGTVQRQGPRVSADLEAEFVAHGMPTQPAVRGRCVDISSTGAFLATESIQPIIATRGDLALSGGEEPREFLLGASVVRVGPGRDGSNGFALRFEVDDLTTRLAVGQFIDEVTRG